MTLIQRVTRVGTAPETGGPDPDRKLISGDSGPHDLEP